MFHTFLKSILSCLAICGTVEAADSVPQPVPATSNAPESDRPLKTPYSVYASSGCSRSFRKVGSYPTVTEAQRVAAAQSDPKLVWIATGDESLARNLFPSLRDGLQLSGCSVYVAGCRLGWREYSRVATAKEAEALVADLDKAGNTVVLVYHLANAAKP
jgi:hypothetical protein